MASLVTVYRLIRACHGLGWPWLFMAFFGFELFLGSLLGIGENFGVGCGMSDCALCRGLLDAVVGRHGMRGTS